MPILLASTLLLLAAQGPLVPLKGFNYKPAITAGQREVVLGPALQGDVTMEVRFEKETPPEFTQSKIFGESFLEYAVGYVRWEVTDGTLFDKPCRILKMTGVTKGINKAKPKDIGYATGNETTYWITSDGKLLRQSVRLSTPDVTQIAECVYWSDHIEVSVTDSGGTRKSFAVYPNVDLSLLDNQFEPMVLDNKVVLSYKEYLAFDPFTQTFTKYKATAGGQFHGSWLGTKFEGTHVTIEGPKNTVDVFVSKEGDLVKVQLPEDKELVLNNLPHSKDPKYKATAGAGH